MTDCTEYEILLSARLDGELSPKELIRLDEHLSICPSCQALAAELDTLHRQTIAIAPTPPVSLAANVRKQVQAEANSIPFPAKNGAGKQWKRCGALAAALALVLVGGSFFAASPFSPFHPAGSAADAETAAVTEEALTMEAATDSPSEAVPEEELAEPAEAKEAEMNASSGSGTPSCADTDESIPAAAETAETGASYVSAADSAAPLSKAQAQSLLRDELTARGGHWTVTGDGRSADGTAWLFTAKETTDRLTHRFSVSVTDGTVTELSPGE